MSEYHAFQKVRENGTSCSVIASPTSDVQIGACSVSIE